MIDFTKPFQNDELSYGDYEKMSLISKIMFRNFLRQFKTKTACSYVLNKVYRYLVEGGGGYLFSLHHPKTAKEIKLRLSDFKDTPLRHILQVKPVN